MRAVLFALSVLLVAGCQSPPPRKDTYTERVILLPSRDGRPSAVVVKRDTGEQQLSKPYESIERAGGVDTRTVASAENVQQRYAGTLAAQPPRPLTFTLFFNLGTTDLTPQSRAQAQELQSKLAAFPAPQVSVIGHTDTRGTTELNDALSLKRALAVRDYLIGLGIPAQSIDAVGRGSRELLVPTKPGVAEERNRRVEVRLR